MQVIPVIDLLDGRAVHAVRGERQAYRPVVSDLVDSSDPVEVARAFRTRLNTKTLYVADLDAIVKGIQSPKLWQTLSHQTDCLWLDTGISNRHEFRRLTIQLENALARLEILLPLERIDSPVELRAIVDAAPSNARLRFSIDLHAGSPLASDAWREFDTPAAIGRSALSLGIRRLLLLDLHDVGSGGGASTVDLARELLETDPDLDLALGGGIRDSTDLQQMQRQRIRSVLVATALHNGSITAADIQAVASS